MRVSVLETRTPAIIKNNSVVSGINPNNRFLSRHHHLLLFALKDTLTGKNRTPIFRTSTAISYPIKKFEEEGFMKRTLIVLIMIAALLAPAAVVYGAETIKIGALYTMTGRGGQYGKDSEVAIKIALDEVNAKGLPDGKKLEVILTDDKNPQYAVSVAKRYITEDKVKFLFGIISSSIGLAVTEVSKEYKVIFIGSDHAATDLTANKFQKYYFRSSNNTFQSMMAGAMYLKEAVTGWKKIAYIGPDYAYGRDQWMEVKWCLDKLGVKYEVTGEYWPKLYEPDYTSYITAIMKSAPDILIVGFWGGDTVSFIKQAKPYGLFSKMKYFHPDAGETMKPWRPSARTCPRASSSRRAIITTGGNTGEQNIRAEILQGDGAIPLLCRGRRLCGHSHDRRGDQKSGQCGQYGSPDQGHGRHEGFLSRRPAGIHGPIIDPRPTRSVQAASYRSDSQERKFPPADIRWGT